MNLGENLRGDVAFDDYLVTGLIVTKSSAISTVVHSSSVIARESDSERVVRQTLII